MRVPVVELGYDTFERHDLFRIERGASVVTCGTRRDEQQSWKYQRQSLASDWSPLTAQLWINLDATLVVDQCPAKRGHLAPRSAHSTGLRSR